MKKTLTIALILCMLFSLLPLMEGCSGNDDNSSLSNNTNVPGQKPLQTTGNSTSSISPVYSEGLEYAVSQDRTYILVTGIGTCKDTTIIIPPTHMDLPVKAIAECAFAGDPYYNVPSIREVILPDSITDIQEGAFAYAKYLTKIVFGKDIKNIGHEAFVGCNNIQEVYIDNLKTWCGINFASSFSNPFYTTSSSSNRKMYINGVLVSGEVIIPMEVTVLKSYVFSGCDFITNVKIGNQATEIGDNAFRSCSNLMSVEIGTAVAYIGHHAFKECSMLLNVEFSNLSDWKYIPEYAFYDSEALLEKSSLEIPTIAAMYLTDTYSEGNWEKLN